MEMPYGNSNSQNFIRRSPTYGNLDATYRIRANLEPGKDPSSLSKPHGYLIHKT